MKCSVHTLLILFICVMQAPLALAGGRKDKKEQPVSEEPVQVEPQEPEPVPKPRETRVKPKGTLSGKITDEDGKPLQGVEVSCTDAENRVVGRMETDQDGKYLFKDLPEGEYTIKADYPGFATKRIELKGEKEPPSVPTGLVVSEITTEAHRTSVIRAQWDRADGVEYYRCELYLDGGPMLQQYPDMKQNFCEFGGLEPDTGYRVRVYAKNNAGYSKDPAERLIRTKSGRLDPPFGLGVTYARNNVVELVWDRIESEELAGFILQIKREGGTYRYYSKEGLKSYSSEAYLIENVPGGPITCRIDDVFEGNVPLLENTVPYSFRVFAVDRTGSRSNASNAVSGIMLEDTIAPQPPANIQHEFIGTDLLRITWETKDRDVDKFRLYYGVSKERWDGVVTTSSSRYDLRVNREALENGEIYIHIIAIDRAGNESGFRTVQRSTTLQRGIERTEDIVLSSEYGFRDSSVAIGQFPTRVSLPKKVVKEEPVRPKRYGYETLRKKGFVIGMGETATLSGELSLPSNAAVHVRSGGTLIIRDAKLSPAGTRWGGIRFQEGSGGSLQNSTLQGAATGIEIIGSKGTVSLMNVTIQNCEEYGLHIKRSTTELNRVTFRENKTGLFAEDSRLTVRGGFFENNIRGLLASNHRIVVEDSEFRNNGRGGGYGIRLYGGGLIRGSRFTGNYVGIVVEKGIGNVLISDCKVQVSEVDGMVIATTSVEVRRNIVLGNGRHGIYIRDGANPVIAENDIYNNTGFAVTGGGQINKCYIAFNNGSIYIDDTEERGIQDNLFTSSSTGVVKQILNVDYIGALSFAPVVQ